ncbi:MAG: hypothetical protein OWQ56_01040 [Acidithiobacillus caldus]|nr:hypothetical protein [Acidithiobacillus caldus]
MTPKTPGPKLAYRSVGRALPPRPSGKPAAQSAQLVLLMHMDGRFFLAYPGGIKHPVELGQLRRDGWTLRDADPEVKALWERAFLM